MLLLMSRRVLLEAHQKAPLLLLSRVINVSHGFAVVHGGHQDASLSLPTLCRSASRPACVALEIPADVCIAQPTMQAFVHGFATTVSGGKPSTKCFRRCAQDKNVERQTIRWHMAARKDRLSLASCLDSEYIKTMRTQRPCQESLQEDLSAKGYFLPRLRT